MEAALEAGAEDIDVEDDGSISVITPWEALGDVANALRQADLGPEDVEVSMVPSAYVSCGEEQARAVLNLIDALEEIDDVQNVYSNGEYPESAYDD